MKSSEIGRRGLAVAGLLVLSTLFLPRAPAALWPVQPTSEAITGLEPYSMAFPGVDAINALLSALRVAPHVLESLIPPGGRLTWLEGEDLGFPASPPLQKWRFQPADGSSPREITVRIGHPERTRGSWSALVEVGGFGEPYTAHEERIHGASWAKALELAAAAVPILLQAHVDKAGGGALDEMDGAPACRVPGDEGAEESKD